ncbi:class I SAM-dependent methyltransferase [Winogradskyella maritima]|uniref:Class I SAM-dependent methyltransferase n=1 Tax=Winogradskyella maritima TaxID=1517766 RepID=A0ABV8ALJ7_9FLAO|nr:class I SAM-dependent methyltransferase [Winogradskyella maritima]
MKTLIYIFLGLAILTPLVIKFLQHRHLYPFMPFKYNFRRRRVTFAKVLRLLNERQAKSIIETGTSRKGLDGTKSDGAATIVFGKWAKRNGAKMHSVDISEDSVKGSRAAVEENGLSDVVTVYLEDSLTFLERFNEQVDFLYLDSYDYSKTDTEIQHKSQVHHLEEFKLIENQLHQDSIVLIDDCGLPGGGKGKLVVEYMLERNWKILIDRYQILLVRK